MPEAKKRKSVKTTKSVAKDKAKKKISKNNKSAAKNKTKQRVSTSGRKIKVNVKGKPAKRSPRRMLVAIGLIIMPLAVGVMSTLVTGKAMTTFGNLNQPPLAPPAWLFPLAWTILYILMGVACLLICKRKAKDEKDHRTQVTEIVLYFAQLFFNYMWTIIFFRLEMRWFAFGWLIVMWMMIIALIALCARNCKPAAWCLVPYALWCAFAIYLNIMIAVLN